MATTGFLPVIVFQNLVALHFEFSILVLCIENLKRS